MTSKKRPALGKGLSALLAGKETDAPSAARTGETPAPGAGEVTRLSVEAIVPNPRQARRLFESGSLAELAASIREAGILQPLAVRRRDDGKYELIAGERRFRAARMIGLSSVPVVVLDASGRESSIMSLIENMQRENLNPIEEAEGIARLMDEFDLTQEQVSERIGKSRSAVANSVRLLNLPDEVKKGLLDETITAGHARAIAGLADIGLLLAAYERIVQNDLSVRETERMVAGFARRDEPGEPEAADPPVREARRRDANLEAYVGELSQTLGRKITVSGDEKKGRVELHYFSREDRDRMLEQLHDLGKSRSS
ncbi:ParB/RepB/Spo0J family partition protein [bacterium]|nr:ParB/RepB/Spo0J family partition protein [bacterium]